MVDPILRYTLRVDRELFGKFRYIAEYEGRSANKEIVRYMKRAVKAFEDSHGEIPLSEQKE